MTTETVIGIVCVITALVIMIPYVQRGLQGGLFGSAQSLGLPFDNRDGYTETQHLNNLNEHVQQQVAWGMLSADLLSAEPLGRYNSGQSSLHPNWVLSSLPTGSVFREPGFQGSKVDSHWSTTRTASYDDNR